MINCVRDDKKTVVSASGGAPQVAADCCGVIRAIYFAIPVEMRPLFKECVLLAVNHKDSPMWQSPPPSSERVVIRSEGKELLKQAKDLFEGTSAALQTGIRGISQRNGFFASPPTRTAGVRRRRFCRRIGRTRSR